MGDTSVVLGMPPATAPVREDALDDTGVGEVDRRRGRPRSVLDSPVPP